MAFEPVIDEAKSHDLKATLPTAAWLFLRGMLSILGLKKRNTSAKA
ncbi:hypothetical protein QZJ86_19030 [Methylomonas montana]|nr:hypothetical protein [Methylomonas montana]WKJ90079.1 hypothetical protein QZJ86_19030 [Methylomonas montana]